MEEKVPLCLRLWQRLHIDFLLFIGLAAITAYGVLVLYAFSNKEDTAIKVYPVFSFIGLPECGPLLTTVSGYRNPVFVPFLCKRGYTCCFFSDNQEYTLL